MSTFMRDAFVELFQNRRYIAVFYAWATFVLTATATYLHMCGFGPKTILGTAALLVLPVHLMTYFARCMAGRIFRVLLRWPMDFFVLTASLIGGRRALSERTQRIVIRAAVHSTVVWMLGALGAGASTTVSLVLTRASAGSFSTYCIVFMIEFAFLLLLVLLPLAMG